jgi:hypothetical protein
MTSVSEFSVSGLLRCMILQVIDTQQLMLRTVVLLAKADPVAFGSNSVACAVSQPKPFPHAPDATVGSIRLQHTLCMDLSTVTH